VILKNKLAPPAKTSTLAAWNWNTVGGILARFSTRSQDRRRLRQKLGISKDALVMGFVGRIVPDKGIRELLDAQRALAEEFPDLYLLLVGELERDHPLGQGIADELVSVPRVLCVGFQRDVASYLAVMDILAHPSFREGLPTAPLEALAMGVPVVATDIPGCVDAVQNGQTGILVPPQDSAALTDAIRILLLDSELRSRMGDTGHQWALEQCKPIETWEVLLSRYKGLLSENASKRSLQRAIKSVRESN
jgi:glycosyltransferase involved in cell wall biosynthesis